MDKDPAMDKMVSNVKVGRGRRVAIAAVAVIVVALLLGVVVVDSWQAHLAEFRGG